MTYWALPLSSHITWQPVYDGGNDLGDTKANIPWLLTTAASAGGLDGEQASPAPVVTTGCGAHAAKTVAAAITNIWLSIVWRGAPRIVRPRTQSTMNRRAPTLVCER